MTETEKLIRELREEIEILHDEFDRLTKEKRLDIFWVDGYLHIVDGLEKQHYRMKAERYRSECKWFWEKR